MNSPVLCTPTVNAQYLPGNTAWEGLTSDRRRPVSAHKPCVKRVAKIGRISPEVPGEMRVIESGDRVLSEPLRPAFKIDHLSTLGRCSSLSCLLLLP